MYTQILSNIESLAGGHEANPHKLLGYHPPLSTLVIWHPGASELWIEVQGELILLDSYDPRGLFIYPCSQDLRPLDYRLYHCTGTLQYDPYAFLPTWSELDSYLFREGNHQQLSKKMGAHWICHEGVWGTNFCVWAPSAKGVSVCCDSNRWKVGFWPMRELYHSGVWELFIPGIAPGEKYKFAIATATGILLKADPYAYASELRPNTASCVSTKRSYPWSDNLWMNTREDSSDDNGYTTSYSKPLHIYEIHLGSWSSKTPTNYRELASELTQYCQEMDYTHVEFMPVMEHPLDESWGYQVTGYFSLTSRWGSADDFKYLINELHNHHIGVILDWVPGHFPSDGHGLAYFDGQPLYEHQDARLAYHPHWGTHIFNYARPEVVNFLIASALYWCEEFHIDGLRVDAVASILYRDYGKTHGQWLPNEQGGRESLEAIAFLKKLNTTVHRHCKGVLTFAEESSSFPKVTHSVDSGGLGFDFKWNMGWMNDTLRFISRNPLWRYWHHDELTFGLMYAFEERFLLVLSHDEVVHGKRTLLEKIPGDDWQKFATLRLLHLYTMTMPGKKLFFMGQEIGQRREWSPTIPVDWSLLEYTMHQQLHKSMQEMNHFYLNHSELWFDDLSPEGFSWVSCDDRHNNTLVFYRHSPAGRLLCVENFTPNYHPRYQITLPGIAWLKLVFNSDATAFGGSGKGEYLLNSDVKILPNEEQVFTLELPPLAGQIFEAHGLALPDIEPALIEGKAHDLPATSPSHHQ